MPNTEAPLPQEMFAQINVLDRSVPNSEAINQSFNYFSNASAGPESSIKASPLNRSRSKVTDEQLEHETRTVRSKVHIKPILKSKNGSGADPGTNQVISQRSLIRSTNAYIKA